MHVLNIPIVGALRIDLGSVFHIDVPETANALFPNSVFVRGTSSLVSSAGHRRRPERADVGATHMFEIYVGARLISALNIVRQSLN